MGKWFENPHTGSIHVLLLQISSLLSWCRVLLWHLVSLVAHIKLKHQNRFLETFVNPFNGGSNVHSSTGPGSSRPSLRPPASVQWRKMKYLGGQDKLQITRKPQQSDVKQSRIMKNPNVSLDFHVSFLHINTRPIRASSGVKAGHTSSCRHG